MEGLKYIMIADGKLFLSRSFSVDLAEIFPQEITFNKMDIFWEVQATYAEGKLMLQVINYNPIEYSYFGNQELSKPVTEIIFENLNQNELQPFLSNNATQKQTEHSYNTSKSKTSIKSLTTNFIIEKSESTQRSIHEHFEVLYKNATIKNAMIVFEKKISWYYSPIQIQITNSFLREEFDSIKFYFGKVINGGKRFSVYASFKLIDNIVTDVSATSPEIEQINDKLVDVVKKKMIKGIIDVQSKKEKSLIDVDELFESLDGNAKNLLNQTPEEVIKEVITWDGIRSGKQLQYLSGLKQSKDKKILFSLKPYFGFMFTINGQNKNHYCWELLNSHATYIWTIENDVSEERIEEIITRIQEGGRNNYKQLYKAGMVDQDTTFEVLIHSIKTGIDPFSQWKSQLESIIS